MSNRVTPRVAVFLMTCGLVVTPAIAQAASARSAPFLAARSSSAESRAALVAGRTDSLATNDFDITAAPTAASVTPGNSRRTTISTTVTNGAPQSLALSASGMPTGVTATFTTTPIMSGASTSLRVDVATSTVPGTYPVVVTATGSGATHTADYSLEVKPLPSYVTVNDVTVSETAGNANLTLTRSGRTTDAATVTVGTADRAATAGLDFTALPSTDVSFAAGQTTATVSVPILDDTVGESDETFLLQLISSSNVTIADSAGTVTITDNDAATYLSINDVSVAEGSSGTSQATFTVTRSGNTTAAASVRWATHDGTARAGSDYTLVSNALLSFVAGQTTATATVSVATDTVLEPDEDFSVALTSPTNAVLRDASGLAIILDDEARTYYSVNDVSTTEGSSGTHPVAFTVTRSGNLASAGSVVVSTANGTALSGSDYAAVPATTVSFAAGDVSKTVSVSVVGDTTQEADETLGLRLAIPVGGSISDAAGTATIVDDDATPYLSLNDVVVTEGNSGTRNATFTLTRSGNTTVTSSVKYATVNGSALSGSDYTAVPLTQVSFAAGDTTKTLTVPVLGDTRDEKNEAFSVKLTSPVGATLSDASGTGTIVDDDGPVTAGPRTFFSVDDGNVAEGGGSMTFHVTRSGTTSGASKITVATSNSSAVAPSDYTAKAATVLSFGAGDTTKNVVVPIVQDTADEANEVFRLRLTSNVAGTISDNLGAATIVDDDATSFLSIGDIATTEGSGSNSVATFTVTRTGNTAVPVTAKYSTVNGTALAGSDFTSVVGAPLTFVAGQLTQTISVPVIGDLADEPAESFSVRLSSVSGAVLSDDTAVETIVDDDAPTYLSVDDVTTTEGNSGTHTVAFTITRSGSTTLPATVTYSTYSGGTATAGADYTAIPATKLTLVAGQTTATVLLTVVSDIVDEPSESVVLRLSTPTGAVLSDDLGRANITDDDAPTFLAVQDALFQEGNAGTTTVTFTVVRSGVTAGASTVRVSTLNFTALSGSDFVAVPATTLSFAAGDTTKNVTVTINGDVLVEADETFGLTLSSPTGATLLDSTAVGTIENDD